MFTNYYIFTSYHIIGPITALSVFNISYYIYHRKNLPSVGLYISFIIAAFIVSLFACPFIYHDNLRQATGEVFVHPFLFLIVYSIIKNRLPKKNDRNNNGYRYINHFYQFIIFVYMMSGFFYLGAVG